jgi:hypothetical protein
VPDTGGAGVPAGTTGVESPIGADLFRIVENLLRLGEEMSDGILHIPVKMLRIIKTHRKLVRRSTTICHTFASAHFRSFLP